MSKKILIPVVAVLLVALLAGAWVSADVRAQGERPGALARLRRARPVVGQVMAVTESQFKIQTRAGVEVTFLVDENTRFRSREQSDLSFGDVRVGLWVGVLADRREALAETGKPLARMVILLPEDVDPTKMSPARGRVVSVDISGKQFTLEDQQGQETTLSVDEDTIFRGEAANLAALKEGMSAFAAAEKIANGDLLARSVRAGYLPLQVVGEISKVNASSDEFTLTTTRDSKALTFKVDQNTLFRSQDGALQSLDDLHVGMAASVFAKSQPGGTFLATQVAAGEKEDLPQADKRILGRITEIGSDTITVTGRDRQEYTLQITSETRFRSRGNLVQGLEDLRQGMAVAVGANDLGNGQYQAQVVLVLPRFRMR